MLVLVAQAAAENTFKLNLAGTGSGEVISGVEKKEAFAGTPQIVCSGPPAAGVCENTMDELFPGFVGVVLNQIPDPGSEFVGWTITKGEPLSPCELEGCAVGTEEGGDTEVTATFNAVAPAGPELTVAKEGTGAGTVVSSPAGIECGGTCTAAFEENTKVTLTASPSAGSLFVSWKGCEKGGVNGRQCTVTMDKAKTVNAKFIAAYDVEVNRIGSGLGKVSSSPGGVLCLSNCSGTTAAFKEGTSVTLTAAPSKNYVLTEWTGDCSGSSLTCSLGTLGEDKEVGATFSPVPQHDLSLTKSGGGNGTVKAAQAGINCGATCSEMSAGYYQGTEVELTATPGKGSAFGGWSGGGCSGTGTCKVTMSSAKSVTAEFK